MLYSTFAFDIMKCSEDREEYPSKDEKRHRDRKVITSRIHFCSDCHSLTEINDWTGSRFERLL